MIFAQGGAGLAEVDDAIGVTEGGGGLDGAFGLDEGEVMQAVGVEEVAGEAREVGGDAQVTTMELAEILGEVDEVGHALDVDPGGGDGELQDAVTEAEMVVQDEQVVVFHFTDEVQAGDAEFDGAIGDLGDDVTDALEEDDEAGQGGDAAGVLARIGFVHTQATSAQEVLGGGGEHALAGQGEGDALSHYAGPAGALRGWSSEKRVWRRATLPAGSMRRVWASGWVTSSA